MSVIYSVFQEQERAQKLQTRTVTPVFQPQIETNWEQSTFKGGRAEFQHPTLEIWLQNSSFIYKLPKV